MNITVFIIALTNGVVIVIINSITIAQLATCLAEVSFPMVVLMRN